MAVLSPSGPTRLARGWRPILLPLGMAASAMVGVGYVANVDPGVAGHYPTCPFLAVTGWYCPGCGTLRAVHALGRGDLLTAWARNPLAVVGLGYLLVTWVLWFERTVTGRRPSWLAPPWVLYGVVGAILMFWVLRNLPGWTWLSPA